MKFRKSYTFYPLFFAITVCQTATSISGKMRSSGATLSISNGSYLLSTVFLNQRGDTLYNIPLRVWYRDSMAIEEIVGTGSVTDENNVTTIEHPFQFCIYLDLRRDSVYDLSSLTDTARVLRRYPLPDSIMPGPGWAFFSKKQTPFDRAPHFFGDTTIDGKTWKLGYITYRIKFDRYQHRVIGFFCCGEPYSPFSLEHGYYEQSGCRLDRILDFFDNYKHHTVDQRIEKLADKIPDSINHLFDSWQRRFNSN